MIHTEGPQATTGTGISHLPVLSPLPYLLLTPNLRISGLRHPEVIIEVARFSTFNRYSHNRTNDIMPYYRLIT